MPQFEFFLGMGVPKQFKKPNSMARLLPNYFVTQEIIPGGLLSSRARFRFISVGQL